MKILMNADCVGGVWTYAVELTRVLKGRGHDVVLAVAGADLRDDQRTELESLDVVWHARPYRLEWMADPWDDVAAAGRWLLDLAARHAVDIVHLNDFAHAVAPFEVPVVLVAHSDVATWWRAVHGSAPGPEWDRYRARVGAALAAADRLVVPSAALLAALRECYDVPPDATVIHNGRSTVDENVEPRNAIVAAGRVWDEAKNLAAAARAAHGLQWPLLLAGEGSAGGVTGLGHLPEHALRRLFAQAQIFVAPARYEPFGLAALEAAQAGCALVLGDIPTLREVWADAATYVAPADEPALRDALHNLIADPSLLSQRQAAARARAARYTPTRMGDAYDAVYMSLLGSDVPAGVTS